MQVFDYNIMHLYVLLTVLSLCFPLHNVSINTLISCRVMQEQLQHLMVVVIVNTLMLQMQPYLRYLMKIVSYPPV